MTDEERQKKKNLVERLRHPNLTHGFYGPLCKEAADEIERLAALTQSDAEPVAWRVRDFGDDWILCHSRKQAEKEASAGNLIQPLYTAPPRPDASADLIEAVAKAICSVRYDDPERRMPICKEDSDGPPIWTSYTRHARAAIEVIRPNASALPTGARND